MIIVPRKRNLRILAVKILYSEITIEYAARKDAIDYMKKIFEEEIRISGNNQDRKFFSRMFSISTDEFDELLDGKKNISTHQEDFVRNIVNTSYDLYKTFKKRNEKSLSHIISTLEEEVNFLEKLIFQIFMWWFHFMIEEKDKFQNVKKILDKLISIDFFNDLYYAYKIKDFMNYPVYVNVEKFSREILKNLIEEDDEEILSKKSGHFLEEIFFKYIINNDEFYSFIEDKLFFHDIAVEIMKHNLAKSFLEIKDDVNLIYSEKKLCQNKLFFLNNLIKTFYKEEKNIEKSIENVLENWTLERINLVDRIILQLGAAEINYIKEYPKAAIISEYIEVSKFYHGGASFKFVNGILDKLG